MDLYSFAPIAAILDFAYSFVQSLSQLLAPLAGSASAAAAIVVLTLLVRTVLIPVGISQGRAERGRRRIAPKLAALQERYKRKPELLATKMRELYAAEKTSPFAGFLPVLAQAPVLSIVYGLFILPQINGHANGLLTETLGGVPLGMSLVRLVGGGEAWPSVLVFLALLALVAGVAAISRLVMLRTATPPAANAPAFQARLTGILSWMPFITVIFASFVPLAATIYLATTTTWTLVERAIVRRALGGGTASVPTIAVGT